MKYDYPRSTDPLELLRIAVGPRTGFWYAAGLAEAAAKAQRLLDTKPDIKSLDIIAVSGRRIRRVNRTPQFTAEQLEAVADALAADSANTLKLSPLL